jgi:hypothetical protein
MKKILTGLAIAGVLTACNNDANPSIASDTNNVVNSVKTDSIITTPSDSSALSDSAASQSTLRTTESAPQ